MNQFHTPSFGDEVFEMNDTPLEQQTQHETASRRISRLSSLDQSTLDDDEDDHLDHYETPNRDTYGSDLHHQQLQQQQQQQHQHQQQQQQQEEEQGPIKPHAPYALFFRDTMTAIKQQNPACTLDQITAIALNMWDSMDEKQRTVYDQRHETEKRDYMRLLRDYQRNQDDQPPEEQHPQPEQQLPVPVMEPMPALAPPVDPEPSCNTMATQQPEQIQLLTEAAAVQKCTRDQCNKPAIINPDWEDEYCSNECVVIHCRNVFTEWARSLQNSPT